MTLPAILRLEEPVPFWAKIAPEQIAEAEKHGVPVAFENDLGMRFVLIPAGTFLMGSPRKEESRDGDEGRQTVRLSKPYYLQIGEVTNACVRTWRPDHHNAEVLWPVSTDAHDLPAVVWWPHARVFARWLSKRSPRRAYRLPTEAEWEYACRAGTTSPYYWGRSTEGAAHHEHSAEGCEERAKAAEHNPDAYPATWDTAVHGANYDPNAWGLYDMLGNVMEWCSDFYHPLAWPSHDAALAAVDPTGPAGTDERVVKGIHWEYGVGPRCASRHGFDTRRRDADAGFRLVSPLPEPDEGGR